MFIALISATLLILLKNPVHSLFSLLISIISSICVLLLIKVEFLAYVFLIVYVGAIAILFLFVIMMLNIKVSNDKLIDYSS
jgi:NADH-quinone oxidoreductase subunit J